MKHSYKIAYKSLLLRQIEKDDLENLRNWRNNAETTKYLRKVGCITTKMQTTWFDNYLTNEKEILRQSNKHYDEGEYIRNYGEFAKGVGIQTMIHIFAGVKLNNQTQVLYKNPKYYKQLKMEC